MTIATPGAVFVSALGTATLAIDAELVTVVEPTHDDPTIDEPVIDVAEVLHLDAAEPLTERKSLRVSSPTGPFCLVVGARTQLQTLEAGMVLPLPDLVAGLAQTTGIVGLIQTEERPILMIDPETIRAVASREG